MLLGLEPLAQYEQNQHCGPGTIGPGAVGPALLGLRCHWSSGPGAVGPDATMQAAAFRPSGRCRPGPSSTQAVAGAVSPISARGPRLVQQITTPPSPRWWRVPWLDVPAKGRGRRADPLLSAGEALAYAKTRADV